MPLEIRHLRLLDALAEEGSLSAASDLLHVTQPSASRGLREIEETLGCTIAHRGPSGTVLTPIGIEAAERARGILVMLSDFETLGSARQWNIDFAYASSGAELAVAAAATRWADSHDGAAVRMLQFDEPARAVEQGRANVGLTRGADRRATLASRLLYTEGLDLVLPRTSEWAKHGTDLPAIDDLRKLRLIRNISSGAVRSGESVGLSGLRTREVRGMTEWLSAVSQMPDAFGLTPESTKEHYQHPDLVFRSFQQVGTVETRLVWRPSDSAAAEFAETVCALV